MWVYEIITYRKIPIISLIIGILRYVKMNVFACLDFNFNKKDWKATEEELVKDRERPRTLNSILSKECHYIAAGIAGWRSSRTILRTGNLPRLSTVGEYAAKPNERGDRTKLT